MMARRRVPRRPAIASGVNRPTPKLPADKRRTYAIDAKGNPTQPTLDCSEVDCGAYRNGFKIPVDENTKLGAAQAEWIRYHSKRRYRQEPGGAPGLVVFHFPPGQRCFGEHRAPLYLVRGGDHRGNPRGERRVHTRPELWVEDLREHTDTIARARE